ncbi:hypothetical protein, conserved [Trypanosoma brucei gambiense DAL972]|uniref:COX assembly mitochondrial protein n=1 Tax=Trypanosoma brucei gambiense (strain MHOM/CI/86/DAL972) TaxID=679716 RepID=C9ZK53_TRYB9|nr:hypothetical protein, conserved [Trypanosoma brucei gambiense DAL972]CBH09817.1 hypothetical protein, conserved [Trypanosoma brucei gambiense DAL972]|eukprot:XP_011772110.1 hypothetical protein, conserved [Trypanosoma brucei gambiense DAL972]
MADVLDRGSTSEGATGDTLILRLPQYFPTTVKECTEETNQFFTCFEEHAVMKEPTDRITAKTSLMFCQKELRGYMTCMEKHRNVDKTKFWWKFW